MIKAIIFDLHGVLINVPSYDENKELISYLRKIKAHGLKLFVLSNSTKETAHEYLARFPFLHQSLDHFYYSGQTGFIKPNPQAYHQILSENNLQPNECLYFDDSPSYLEVATQLGIKSFLYQGVDDLKSCIHSSSVMHN